MTGALSKLVEWIRSKIPGYDGYENIEKRSEIDALVRDKVYRELSGSLANVKRGLESAFDDSDSEACNKLEKTRAEIELLMETIKETQYVLPRDIEGTRQQLAFKGSKNKKPKIEKAGGLTRQVVEDKLVTLGEIKTKDLNRIIEIDEAVLRTCEQIKQASFQIAIGPHGIPEINSGTTLILSKVLEIEEAFQIRRDIITGASEEIHD